MTVATHLRRAWPDFLSAVQFLTRVPVPSPPYEADSLARATRFFPLVGAMVGGSAAIFHLLLAQHLNRSASAFLVLLYTVIITGGLHEDGLADAADGFGGGTSREKILLILRDSRIGTYGGMALILSVAGRWMLIASLPLALVPQYLIAANMLSRWTTLPLSYYLPSARTEAGDGQGSRIARLTSPAALIGATIFSFAAASALLRGRFLAPVLSTILIALVTGAYYKRRIGGVTGDCFGATIQLAEIAVYLCGAWNA